MAYDDIGLQSSNAAFVMLDSGIHSFIKRRTNLQPMKDFFSQTRNNFEIVSEIMSTKFYIRKYWQEKNKRNLKGNFKKAYLSLIHNL